MKKFTIVLTALFAIVFSFAKIKVRAAEATSDFPQVYDSSVNVHAYFLNPKDWLLLSEAQPTGIMHEPNSTSATEDSKDTNTQETAKDSASENSNAAKAENSSAKTEDSSTEQPDELAPVYYVYAPRYDVAYVYNPVNEIVTTGGTGIEISTTTQYGKYKIVPLVGQNRQRILTEVHLKEYKFKSPDEFINVVAEKTNIFVTKLDVKYGKLQRKGDFPYIEFSYKTYDYDKLWKDYTAKNKKKSYKAEDYLTSKKGAAFFVVKDKTVLLILDFDIKEVSEEVGFIKSMVKKIYVNPSFIKEQAYQIQGTDIIFTFNRRYWFTTFEKYSVFLNFYHEKYETKPEYAAMYSSTATLGIYPYKETKDVTQNLLKEIAINGAKMYLASKNPKLAKDKLAKLAESKVYPRKTANLTWYCYDIEKQKTVDWGGYKPSGAEKAKYTKTTCTAGKGKTRINIIFDYIEGSQGYKELQKIIDSFDIEVQTTVTASPTPTPSKTSWFLDGNLHIIPVVSAAQQAPDTLSLDSVLAPLGTVKVFSLSCSRVRVPAVSPFNELRIANKIYTLCSAGSGSGFLVNDSYVVTNAHVAAHPPIEDVIVVYGSAVKAISQGQMLSAAIDHGLTKDMLLLAKSLVEYYEARGAKFANRTQVIQSLAIKLLKTMVANLRLSDMSSAKQEVWVSQGKNGTFAVMGDNIILRNSAQMIKGVVMKKFDITGNYFVAAGFKAGQTLKPDLALVKLNSTIEAPALYLGTTGTIKIGDKVMVIGFPGVIEMSSFLSAKSSYPSLSKGNITGIKDAAGGAFKLVQLSASIAHGNSGGPVVNSDSEVIGVLTYSFTAGSNEAADLSGAVDVQEVRKMLDSQNIKYNESALSEKVRLAVEEYNKMHYKNAKKLFEEVKAKNPSYFGYILNPIITKAQEYIDQGLDKSNPLLSLDSMSKYVIPVLAGLLLFGILVVLIKALTGKNKNRAVNGRKTDVSDVSSPGGAGGASQSPSSAQNIQATPGSGLNSVGTVGAVPQAAQTQSEIGSQAPNMTDTTQLGAGQFSAGQTIGEQVSQQEVQERAELQNLTQNQVQTQAQTQVTQVNQAGQNTTSQMVQPGQMVQPAQTQESMAAAQEVSTMGAEGHLAQQGGMTPQLENIASTDTTQPLVQSSTPAQTEGQNAITSQERVQPEPVLQQGPVPQPQAQPQAQNFVPQSNVTAEQTIPQVQAMPPEQNAQLGQNPSATPSVQQNIQNPGNPVAETPSLGTNTISQSSSTAETISTQQTPQQPV